MADHPTPPADAKPADAAAAATPKSGGGIAALLPLILTPILCAGAAFGVFQFVIKPGLVKSINEAVAKATHAAPGDDHSKTDDGHGKSDPKKDDGHGKSDPKKDDGHGKSDPKKDDAKGKADPKKADKNAAPAKEDDPNEPVAVSERTVANVANTGGQRYLVVKIALIRGEAKDVDFPKRVEKYRDRLDAAASTILASKTLEELEKPGIRTLVKAELQGEFNRVLGHASVKEVLFPVWVIQ